MGQSLVCFYTAIDMIKRRNLRTRNIKVLVLDEADEMLNKGEINYKIFCYNTLILTPSNFFFFVTSGFKEQIYDVYRYLPPDCQVC